MKNYRIIRIERPNETYFIIKYRWLFVFWLTAYHPLWDSQVLKYGTLEEAEDQIHKWELHSQKPRETVEKIL